MSDPGAISLIVGMQVIRGQARRTPKCSEHQYVNSLHEMVGMNSCTPVHARGSLNQLVDDATEDPRSVRHVEISALVGSLILSQSTRLYICIYYLLGRESHEHAEYSPFV